MLAHRSALFLALFCLPLAAESLRLRGFLVEQVNPNTWVLEDSDVTTGRKFTLELPGGRRAGLKVGSEVLVQGSFDQVRQSIFVATLKELAGKPAPLQGEAVTLKLQELRLQHRSWRGELLVDGRRVAIVPATRLAIEGAVEVENNALRIPAGTLVEYSGTLTPSGVIQAATLRLAPGVARATVLRRRPLPDLLHDVPAAIELPSVGPVRLVRHPQAQQYIQDLGDRLIPQAQRELEADDPHRIPFRFVLAHENEANAYALADGTIVVNDGLFLLLRNEAQLAAIMAHEIAHLTQAHLMRQDHAYRLPLQVLHGTGTLADKLKVPKVVEWTHAMERLLFNRFWRRAEAQADRLGMEYMRDAGFDPREAARVWLVKALHFGDRKPNAFRDAHDSYQVRRSVLMQELRHNYTETDFHAVQQDSAEFHRVAWLLKR